MYVKAEAVCRRVMSWKYKFFDKKKEVVGGKSRLPLLGNLFNFVNLSLYIGGM